MRILFLVAALGSPLLAAAQSSLSTAPPLVYHAALVRLPLYHTLDQARSALPLQAAAKPGAQSKIKSNNFIPAEGEVKELRPAAPQVLLVNYRSFEYFLPSTGLADYDSTDIAPVPLDSRTQLISYKKVLVVPGASKAELLARARAWLARTYDPSSLVIEKQDTATGQLLLQGTRVATAYRTVAPDDHWRSAYAGVVHHQLTISVKNGRCRFAFTNLVHDAAHVPYLRSGGPLEQERAGLFGLGALSSNAPWQDLRLKALRDVRHLSESLEYALTLRKPQPTKPDDEE